MASTTSLYIFLGATVVIVVLLIIGLIIYFNRSGITKTPDLKTKFYIPSEDPIVDIINRILVELYLRSGKRLSQNVGGKPPILPRVSVRRSMDIARVKPEELPGNWIRLIMHPDTIEELRLHDPKRVQTLISELSIAFAEERRAGAYFDERITSAKNLFQFDIKESREIGLRFYTVDFVSHASETTDEGFQILVYRTSGSSSEELEARAILEPQDCTHIRIGNHPDSEILLDAVSGFIDYKVRPGKTTGCITLQRDFTPFAKETSVSGVFLYRKIRKTLTGETRRDDQIVLGDSSFRETVNLKDKNNTLLYHIIILPIVNTKSDTLEQEFILPQETTVKYFARIALGKLAQYYNSDKKDYRVEEFPLSHEITDIDLYTTGEIKHPAPIISFILHPNNLRISEGEIAAEELRKRIESLVHRELGKNDIHSIHPAFEHTDIDLTAPKGLKLYVDEEPGLPERTMKVHVRERLNGQSQIEGLVSCYSRDNSGHTGLYCLADPWHGVIAKNSRGIARVSISPSFNSDVRFTAMPGNPGNKLICTVKRTAHAVRVHLNNLTGVPLKYKGFTDTSEKLDWTQAIRNQPPHKILDIQNDVYIESSIPENNCLMIWITGDPEHTTGPEWHIMLQVERSAILLSRHSDVEPPIPQLSYMGRSLVKRTDSAALPPAQKEIIEKHLSRNRNCGTLCGALELQAYEKQSSGTQKFKFYICAFVSNVDADKVEIRILNPHHNPPNHQVHFAYPLLDPVLSGHFSDPINERSGKNSSEFWVNSNGKQFGKRFSYYPNDKLFHAITELGDWNYKNAFDEYFGLGYVTRYMQDPDYDDSYNWAAKIPYAGGDLGTDSGLPYPSIVNPLDPHRKSGVLRLFYDDKDGAWMVETLSRHIQEPLRKRIFILKHDDHIKLGIPEMENYSRHKIVLSEICFLYHCGSVFKIHYPENYYGERT